MFRCDHHHQGAHCVCLLKLQCQNNWLKYIIVVNLVVWRQMLSGPSWRVSAALQILILLFKTILFYISW